MVPWDPEGFAGVGPEAQPVCAVPACGRPTAQRGLCDTCYHAWWRHGMAGLERRAKRCAGGATVVRVPLDVSAALEMLIDVYERWVDGADGATEPNKALRKTLVKICDAVGNVERRRRQREFRDQYRKGFIQKYGIEAWRAKQAASQRAHRSRKRARLEGKENHLPIGG